MIPNPFSILGAKVFAGVAALAIAGLAVQTVRIEGAFCRQVKLGEKPACVVQGFKQQLAVIRIDLDQVRADRDAERARHEATKQAYRAAQAEAEQLENARLARITAQQNEVNDDLRNDYARRIAAARADYDRLRRAQGTATRGGASGTGVGITVSALPDAAGGVDGAAGDRGLSLDQRFEATRNTAKLIGLQAFIRRQAAIDPNH